jgi:hypothetical protein
MHPTTEFVLDAIQMNWDSGFYSDIPLTRIDRINANNFETDARELFPSLSASNYFGAAKTGFEQSPIGTEYDSQTNVTVSVRVSGLHEREHGHINEDARLPPDSPNGPVPWEPLLNEIRTAIYRSRTFPNADCDIDFMNLVIRNEQPSSLNIGLLYETTFDVVFEGYEELP